MVLNNLDDSAVQDALKTWSSNSIEIGDFPLGGITTGGTVTTGYYQTYPYTSPYPFTWITYGTNDTSNHNKVLVTKAENGFVLVYNNKTWIAKNEADVAKIVTKVLTEKEKTNGKV